LETNAACTALFDAKSGESTGERMFLCNSSATAAAMAESQTATNSEARLTELEFNQKYTLEHAKLDSEETRATAKFDRRKSIFQSQLKRLNRELHRLKKGFEREQEQHKHEKKNIQERRTKLGERIELGLQLRHQTIQDLREKIRMELLSEVAAAEVAATRASATRAVSTSEQQSATE
jgi:hypothetical protein